MRLHRRVPAATIIFLLDHLRVMLCAGISVSRSLTIIRAHLRQRALTTALAEVSTAVEGGTTLADALDRHPDMLPAVARALIRAGETSGTLEEALGTITNTLRKEDELRSRVRNALLYPSIVVGAMLVMVVGIVTFVLPRLLSLFEGVTVPLPLATRVLLATTAFLKAYGLLVALVVIAVVILGVLALRTARGRLLAHRALLRFGRIGTIAQEVNLARIARTLGGLLRTDIPIVRALDLTAATLANRAYRDALLAAARATERGDALSASWGAAPRLFPPTAVQLLVVGEESGRLDTLLGELADFYELDVDRSLRNLTTIIEPALILAIGAGIALIAVAVLQPMYTVAQAI